MPCLPARIQLQHLRDQADSLLREAGSGDQATLERIRRRLGRAVAHLLARGADPAALEQVSEGG